MDAPAPQDTPPARKRKILLVEDEANIAAMVQDWLAEKYDVSVASDGKTAVRKAAEEKPDIILEDINLPDMLGFDVIRLYQKDPRSAGIPIIILTGQKMVEDTIKFISTEKSVKGFVNKPFKLKEFFEKIELVLGAGAGAGFVLMEKEVPVTPETAQRAQMVREARKAAEAETAAAAAAEAAGPAARAPSKLPPVRLPGPPPPAPRASSGPGFFRLFFGALFKLALWTLWGLAAALAASEATCRLVERFTGGWIFLPPLAASPLDGNPVSVYPGAFWERNGVNYRTNALGLRDADPPAPSTNSFTILALGGTDVFGQDVPLNGVFAKRLEAMVDAAALFGSTGSHRVVNGALWGLSPEEQWTAFQDLNRRLRPDAVLWVPGAGRVLRPSQERLRKSLAWPPQARELVEESRLAGLAGMLYFYEGARAEGEGDLAGRVDYFLQHSTGTPFAVLKLGDGDSLKDLAPRGNLLVFDLSRVPGLDAARKGLTAGGHEALARAVFSLLRLNADRIRPRPPEPPAAARPARPAVRRARRKAPGVPRAPYRR